MRKPQGLVRILTATAIAFALCIGAVSALAQSTLQFTEWAVPSASNCSFGLAAAFADVIYFTDAPCSSTPRIGMLNTRTNTVREWTGAALGSPQGVVALGPLVVFADQNIGTMNMLNVLTNQLTTWTLPTLGSGPLRVAEGGIEIYFTEQAGRVGRLNLLTNRITEWTVPGGPHTPLSIAASPIGNRIWFSQASGAQLGALDLLDNTFSQWTIPSTTLATPFVQGVAASEDRLFFGDSYDNGAVGELDPTTNVLALWTTPVLSGPNQLVVEELGESRFEVDFTDGPGNKIWRLLTALQPGTSSTIPVTTTAVTPTVTLVTPTTSTLVGTSTVVRPTVTNVAGVITGGFEQWLVPTVASNDYAIAKLPGGGVAFTEATGNKIGTLR